MDTEFKFFLICSAVDAPFLPFKFAGQAVNNLHFLSLMMELDC